VAQHFLLSKAAKTLSLAQVFRMTDAEAEGTFRNIRWANTNGSPEKDEEGRRHLRHSLREIRALRLLVAWLPFLLLQGA
jgi:hypothetical protein